MLSVLVLPGALLLSPLLSIGWELYLPGASDPDTHGLDLEFVI